jgi:hypothetical protein
MAILHLANWQNGRGETLKSNRFLCSQDTGFGGRGQLARNRPKSATELPRGEVFVVKK